MKHQSAQVCCSFISVYVKLEKEHPRKRGETVYSSQRTCLDSTSWIRHLLSAQSAEFVSDRNLQMWWTNLYKTTGRGKRLQINVHLIIHYFGQGTKIYLFGGLTEVERDSSQIKLTRQAVIILNVKRHLVTIFNEIAGEKPHHTLFSHLWIWHLLFTKVNK